MDVRCSSPFGSDRRPSSGCDEWLEKLKAVLKIDVSRKNKSDLRLVENAILKLGQHYSKHSHSLELQQLVSVVTNHMNYVSKSRSLKMVRDLLSQILDSDCPRECAIGLAEKCLEMVHTDKHSMLFHSLKIRIAELYFELTDYARASEMLDSLMEDTRKLDNKKHICEVHLLRSKLYHALNNDAKSRSELTCARTAANSIYVSPKMQGELDMQSGALHAKDSDFLTAYSYFIEALDLFVGTDSFRQLKAIKYMCLCKIMLKQPDEVPKLLSQRVTADMQRKNSHLVAIEKVADAFKRSSLSVLDMLFKMYHHELSCDLVIRDHLEMLKQNLFQENLLLLIKPYSCVQISFLADKIQLDETQIILKLSNMILDNVFAGVLDQSTGCLIVKTEVNDNSTVLLKNSIKLVDKYDKIVSVMFKKEKAFKIL